MTPEMWELADEALRLNLHVPERVPDDGDTCGRCGHALGEHSHIGWECPDWSGNVFVPTELGNA